MYRNNSNVPLNVLHLFNKIYKLCRPISSQVAELLLSMFSARADIRLRRALEELPNIFGAAVSEIRCLFSILLAKISN